MRIAGSIPKQGYFSANRLRSLNFSLTPIAMISPLGYEDLVRIYSGEHSRVYRGYSHRDARSVILKVPQSDYPTPEELRRCRQEYRLTHRLHLPNVIHSYRLVEWHRTLIIVFEDFGGISLKKWLETTSTGLALDQFFPIAFAIVEAIEQLHSQQVIHKDLNPNNIVLNPETGLLKVIDLGIATQLSPEIRTLHPLRTLEGTLPYLAPEQTGRMTQGLDYRTDFYALGVTFCELLTGQVPFSRQDPMELVYCHLAKQPPPLATLGDRQIPPGLEAIVLKLMQKNADDRYQSTWGLKADLETAQRQWQGRGEIPLFSLGQEDISDRLYISHTLHGRDREQEILKSTFEWVAHTPNLPQAELLVITGASGIGKSALAASFYGIVTAQRGHLISGKFDRFQRTVPYSAPLEAFTQFIKQRLAESESTLELWQANLMAALGINAQVLIQVMPELAVLLGPQPPVSGVGINEGQNRFKWVLRQFVTACCPPQHPLVLVLDDVQWADLGSLHLLEYLLSPPLPCFVPILVYNNENILPDHPLCQTFDRLEASGVRLQRIHLSPLTPQHIETWLQDILRQPLAAVQPLAALIKQKTQGNPLFIRQFLEHLQTEHHLVFNRVERCWQWDLQRLQYLAMTENVVDATIQQLNTLPREAKQALGMAAAIGSRFDLKILSRMDQTPTAQWFEWLKPALDRGLILPRSPLNEEEIIELYQFSHDRIHQAAYALIVPEERSALHHRIGQVLLESPPQNSSESIFEIVSHLDRAIEQLQTPEERFELARLNLQAAQKAQQNTAYETALEYAHQGLEIVAEGGWQRDYSLTLALYEVTIQLLGICGEWEEFKTLINIVNQEVTEPLDLVNIYQFRIQFETAKNDLAEALKLGKNFLNQLGLVLPNTPSNLDIDLEIFAVQSLIKDRRIEDLKDLPPMGDREKISIVEILTSLIPSAYVLGSSLFNLLVTLSVKYSIQYGNILASSFAYACYGLISCSRLKNFDQGRAFGDLALTIAAQPGYRVVRPKVYHVVTTFISQRTQHIHDGLDRLQEAYSIGLEVGNLEFSGYAYQHFCWSMFCLGHPLPHLAKEINHASHLLNHLNQNTVANYFQLYKATVRNLQGNSNQRSVLAEDVFEEAEQFDKFTMAQDRLGLCFFYLLKLILAYSFEEWDAARRNANNLHPYLASATGLSLIPWFYFYDSLAHLSQLKVSDLDAHIVFARVAENQYQLEENWAKYAPMNYRHKIDLIEAELYRIRGQHLEAIEAYDRAIAGAKLHNYLQEEALANELAAKFYLSWGKETIARSYLREARHHYFHWGAMAKISQLDNKYAALLEVSQSNFLKNNTTFLSSHGSYLDLQTVIKAAQAISEEIVLENLVPTLMEILKENAGAHLGCLLLANPNFEGQLNIAIYSNEEERTLAPRYPLGQILPESIISYVNRTNDAVILEDAPQSKRFKTDPYIQRHHPFSILCYPLLNQGDLIGILYLENKYIRRAFSSDRIELLRLLSGQAVIALRNAQLYAQLHNTQQQFQQFLEAVPLGIGILDRQGHPYYVNQAAQRILGKSTVSNAGATEISQVYQNYIAGTEIPYPNDQLPIIRALRGEYSTVDNIEIRQNNHVIPVEAWGTPIYDEEGSVEYAMAVFQDISDRRRSEQILQDSETRYRTLAEVIPVGIFRNDLAGNCIYANPKLQQMAGLSQADFLISGWSRMVHPEDQDRLFQAWFSFVAQTQLGHECTYHLEYRYLSADGSTRWAVVEALPERNTAGELVGFVGATLDISDRKQAEQILADYSQTLEQKVLERTVELEQANDRLEQLAHLDGLTKVANRRKFDEYLEQQWKRHLQHQKSLSLILFDVDHFKRYNDHYGHQVGDECLIQIAQATQAVVNIQGSLVARYGGEEFVVILSNTSLNEAIEITTRIQQAIQTLNIPHAKSRTTAIVSISLGIATLIPYGGQSSSYLISLADQALYQAKQTGRDRYVVSHNSLRNELVL